MQCLIWLKGLWSTLNETQLNITMEFEWFTHRTKCDEVRGLILLHVLELLFFYIKECITPKLVWEKLMDLFGLVREIRSM